MSDLDLLNTLLPEPVPLDANSMSLRDAVVRLESFVLDYATGTSQRDEDYMALRDRVMTETSARQLLPEWIRTSRSLSQLWSFFKQWKTYEERRHVVWNGFRPLLESLEGEQTPLDDELSGALNALHAEHVMFSWQKAMDRRTGDPEGAITAARTTLESICKLILDDQAIPYEGTEDLPALYGKVAKSLQLSPSDHSEQAFKQILGGCFTVVNGLATLRNRLSDSHGQGAKPIRPSPRHASLAVNLAGAVGLFLVETWEARKP